MSRTFRRSGIYRPRWQYWYPWGLTSPWKPRVFRGANEWCDDSAAVIVPSLGGGCVFWRRALRTVPCGSCWADLDDISRADYAPCGSLYGGRVSDGHHHWETGVCGEARAWVDSREIERETDVH